MFSYHKEDFIIRQIQSAARALAKLFFNSETVSYTIKDESNYTQSDLIYLKIKELMEQHKYLEAQTLLLEHLDSDDLQYLKLILYFYDQLDQMNDEQLAKYYLERQIITNNFIDATSKYNVTNMSNYYQVQNIDYQIEVLVNSEAVIAYQLDYDHEIAKMFTALSKKHVTFTACNNALAANHLTAADIYQFITIVPAGVVELAQKQTEGFAYIKP